MTNTYMEAGDWKKDEIIEDTKEGVYFCGMHTPSIDSRRYNFQISCRIAYEIKDGEIGKPLRGVSIMGTADKFWASVDAAADDVEMRPVANCGKGDPMQTCMVGNGGPHIRAKGKIVGVA
jgi:TldD protein